MAEDLGERTEDATPKRQAEAREEGNVAKSVDLTGALMLLAVTLVLWMAAQALLGNGKALLESALDDSALAEPLNPAAAWPQFVHLGASSLRLVVPVFLLLWLAGVLANFVQTGWLLVPKAVQPKLTKLNPLNNIKRIFGVTGLVKSGMDAFKVGLVVLVTGLVISSHMDEIIVLPYLELGACLGMIGGMMFDLALRIVAVLLVLGIADYTYQRWKHKSELRMTKQQVKDEMKQSEGDPEVKRRRMRIQQQLNQQRIAAAVPKADVVVTNPEHISIAIQYDSASMGAPRVVAKGADFLAMRIRHIAMQHGIPIIERKPLARALYKQVAVNQEIPPEFYKAVAEILAYVYRLSGRMAG